MLLPLLARANSRSAEQMFVIMSRAIRGILLLVLPISLMLGLGADVWVRVLFGASFGPAALSLRVLAPIFVLTYVAMIVSTCLVLLGRAWAVTAVSFGAVVLSLALNAVLIPRAIGWFGPGGAGAGAAMVVVATEGSVVVAFLALVGARAFDRSTVSSIVRAIASCALVVLVDAILRPMGLARLWIDAAAYPALLFALGAVGAEDTQRVMELWLRRRRQHGTA